MYFLKTKLVFTYLFATLYFLKYIFIFAYFLLIYWIKKQKKMSS